MSNSQSERSFKIQETKNDTLFCFTNNCFFLLLPSIRRSLRLRFIYRYLHRNALLPSCSNIDNRFCFYNWKRKRGSILRITSGNWYIAAYPLQFRQCLRSDCIDNSNIHLTLLDCPAHCPQEEVSHITWHRRCVTKNKNDALAISLFLHLGIIIYFSFQEIRLLAATTNTTVNPININKFFKASP